MSNGSRGVPLITEPIEAVVRPPGSKSETIRALAAAALAEGRSHVYEPLEAEDPIAMAGAIGALGAVVDVQAAPWSVDGHGAHLTVPRGPLNANESGLSARILLAMVAGLDGECRIVGRGRLPERPMSGLVAALRALGVELSGDRLPIDVSSRGRLRGGHIEVDCSESSQFATAMMLVAPVMGQPVVLEPIGLAASERYLDGTVSMMRRFGAEIEATITGYEIANNGYQASDVVIEPDASAAVYPLAIAAITRGKVTIEGLGENTWQPDLSVASLLATMGCRLEWEGDRVTIDARGVELRGVETDMSSAPDGALALAVACLFAEEPSHITGLGSLRHKESDRLEAITTEMKRIGGQVEIEDDAITIRPSRLHGAQIDPHGDHRIAMAMATAGTRIPDFAVMNPHVVNKTWPGFWDFLDILVPG